MTTPELTAAERIRVYAAAGGLNLSPETLILVADAIEDSEAAVERAKVLRGLAEKDLKRSSVFLALNALVWVTLGANVLVRVWFA